MATNPYYQTTGNPGAATRGQSANLRAEYSLVQSGFDAVFQALSTHGMVPPGMPTRTITSSGPIALGDYSYALDVTAAGVTLTPDATTLQSYFWCIVNAVGFDVTVSAAFNDGGLTKKVPAGTSLLLSCNGTTFRAVALAQAAPSFGTVGTATVVNASASGQGMGIAAMTSAAAFVVYLAGTAYKVALVDNTGAVLSTATLNASASAPNGAQIIAVDTSRCLVAWNDQSNTFAALVTFSGTTITVGSLLTVDASTSNISGPSICLLSSSVAAIAWRGPATATNIAIAAITIPSSPSTTLSLGTSATLMAGSSNTTMAVRICALNTTQAYVSMMDTGGSAKDVVVTFSGSVVSATPTSATLTYATAPAAVDAVQTQSNRALSLVAFGTSGATPFVSVVEVSGTAGSASWTHGPMVGLPLVFAGPRAIRLQKVSANTYIYIAGGIDGRTSLVVGTIFVRDYGVMVNPPATVLGRVTPGNGMDLTVMGTTLIVVYSDAANSSFPTIRPIPLGGVA